MQDLNQLQNNNCVCCLEPVADLTRSVELSKKIRLEIENVLQIKINVVNLVNKVVCSQCIDNIKAFVKFKNEILKAQKKLLSLLEQQNDCVEISDCDNTRRTSKQSSEANHFCPICNKYFTEARKVKLHVDRIHLRKRDYKCDKCHYSAFKKYDILLHMNNMHKLKAQTMSICPTCGFAFTSNSRLNIHIRRKHLKQTMKKFTCDRCGHQASLLNELKRHIATHLPRDLKETFRCVDCKAVLSSKGSLKVHHDSKHSDKPSISCFCGKSFRQKSVYSRHYQVLHNGIKAFKCDLCQKEFSGKSHLMYHVKAFHSVISTSITCEICGNQYKNKDTLKKHLIYHSSPKFKCAICSKKFHENKKLLDHMSSHRQLEFPCQHCTRSFRLESQLRYHLRKVHFKEKQTFKCELCSATFTRKSTYREHAQRKHKELDDETMTQFLERIKIALPEKQ